MKQVTIHDQLYEFYSWQNLGEDIFSLAQQLLKDQHHFDRIIALAKGGLTFSRSMVDYLGVDNISSIQIEFYTGIGTTQKTPVITQSLPVSIRNESVLVFDDIVDKGDTLKLATQYLGYHGATSITTACLISKPWTSFQANYSVRNTQAWVIFPNEVRETIETLVELWQEAGDTNTQIHEQLLKIGFSETEVAMFANLK